MEIPSEVKDTSSGVLTYKSLLTENKIWEKYLGKKLGREIDLDTVII